MFMTHCYLDESQAFTYFYSFLTRQLSLGYTNIYLSALFFFAKNRTRNQMINKQYAVLFEEKIVL